MHRRRRRLQPADSDCTVIVPACIAKPAPCMALRLHTDHLSTTSALLRGLFNGLSSIDLVQDFTASLSVSLRVPQSCLPRLLLSPPSCPVVFLPVPDPSSILPLFQWMYSGNTEHIENALGRGDIHWEGLAYNVEYLGLSTDIKVFLGHWYRHWLLPAQPTPNHASCPMDEHDESDLDSDDNLWDSDDQCTRGRTRDAAPLLQSCGR